LSADDQKADREVSPKRITSVHGTNSIGPALTRQPPLPRCATSKSARLKEAPREFPFTAERTMSENNPSQEGVLERESRHVNREDDPHFDPMDKLPGDKIPGADQTPAPKTEQKAKDKRN